jgi:hypothetical protein
VPRRGGPGEILLARGLAEDVERERPAIAIVIAPVADGRARGNLHVGLEAHVASPIVDRDRQAGGVADGEAAVGERGRSPQLSSYPTTVSTFGEPVATNVNTISSQYGEIWKRYVWASPGLAFRSRLRAARAGTTDIRKSRGSNLEPMTASFLSRELTLRNEPSHRGPPGDARGAQRWAAPSPRPHR